MGRGILPKAEKWLYEIQDEFFEMKFHSAALKQTFCFAGEDEEFLIPDYQ